jgi:uncharacterized protein YwqG
MIYDFKLPVELEPFRAAMIETELPAVRVLPKKSTSVSVEKSKIGGIPLWPADQDLPRNSAGEPLFFLAQINFSEMPPLADFPQKGVLQFWISDDDGFGLDFDEPMNQADFRIIYFENEASVGLEFSSNNKIPAPDFSFLKKMEGMPIPQNTTYSIDFEPVMELCPTTDYRFWQKFGEDFFEKFGKKEWTIREELEDILIAPGHKVGGYAHFTQEDPRTPNDPMMLLFQLDSDEDSGIQWGDLGVANFFIRHEDLRKLDFSRVVFNWDCY